MTAAGEGTSYQGGGGPGGKFRKKPFRRAQTTPYDRPPAAIRNPRNGWLSRLVDPASKLISASAHMFFSSLFRKRLLPPPQSPPVANQESSDSLQVRKALVPNMSLKNPAEPQESALNDDHDAVSSHNSGGISELEQILKQKTFTRSEIDHLTELLHSRTADLTSMDVNKRIEANLPKMAMPFDKQDEIVGSQMQENGIGSHRQHEVMSSPIVSSKVFEEDVASPAELAKAYMGSRSSKVSPSKSNLHGQVPREEGILLNDIAFPLKSSIISLAPNSTFRPGVSESDFITPRSRGRSAIYSMARAPYSRIYSTTNPKALKRGSSVLDDDIGSVGPIRRIRQKSELLFPKDLSSPVSESPLSSHAIVGYGSTQPPISSTQKSVLLEEPKQKFSKILGEKEDNSICSAKFSLVPSRSTAMATKIFNHLEQMAPKDNSSKSKLAAARDKSPTKLTPSMLSGKALKSLEHVDSSKFLHNALDHQKFEDPCNTSSAVVRGSTSKKQDRIGENSSKSLVIPRDILAPMVSCGDNTIAIEDAVPTSKSGDSAPANVVTQPPQKKRPFQMSAHEDSLELDDDVHSNGDVSSLSAEGREKSDSIVVESKSIITDAAVLEKPTALSKVEPRAGSELNKTNDLGNNDGSVAVGKTTMTLPTAPVFSSDLQPVLVTPQSVSALNKIAPQEEPNVSSALFILSSKNIDNAPQFKFSPSASAAESSGLISNALLDPKPESPNCFPNVASGASDAVSKTFESDKVDNKDSQEAGDVVAKSNIAQSTSMPTNGISSFGIPVKPANDSSQSNGSLTSSSSILSPAPFIPSGTFSNNNWNSSSMHFASSTTISTINSTLTTSDITTACTGSSNASVISSPSSAAPIFSFSSSVAPSTSVSVAPSIFSSASFLAPSTSVSVAPSIVSGASSVTPSTSVSVLPPIFSSASSATPSTLVSVPPPMFSCASSVAPSTSVSAAPPIFSFASSGTPFSSVSALSTSVVQDTNSKVNSEGTNSSNLTNSHIGDASSSVVVSTGSSIFGFSGSAASSSMNNQSQGSPFGTANGNLGDARAPPEVGVATNVFGSSASSSAFGSTGASFASSTSPFGSSTTMAKPFSLFTSFNPSSAALETNSTSTSSGGGTPSLFASSWPATTSPIFGASSSSSVFNYMSSSSSTGFSFGASSGFGAATNNAPSMVFGSSASASSGSIFSFNSAAANPPLASNPQTQPVFGNPNSVFTATGGNSDQMNMEDSMAEDTVQASTTPATPAFGQPSVLPPSGFMFGSSATPGAHSFQFGAQQNQATLQNPSPFQASGSLDHSTGGSFSLGSGGGDKSGRRIVKPSRRIRKK